MPVLSEEFRLFLSVINETDSQLLPAVLSAQRFP
jgi:hypothetical protein